MRYRFLRFPGGREKALTLSYDDGVIYDRQLIETADRYGIKVTLNINSAWMGASDINLSAAELKELTANGHEIAVHGARHIASGNVSAIDGIRDVLECRQKLENAFDTIIRGMAYPDTGITQVVGGASKSEIKAYLKALGIAYSRTLGGDNDTFDLPEDFYEWMPNAHHKNPKLLEYLDKFISEPIAEYAARRTPKLFYLWGHSYEFNNDHNWDLLEKFCKTAGGRKDIWYATNIEICDYVNAYRSLIFNVENTKVYNPTDKEIWFEASDVNTGNQLFCVRPGETLNM